MAADRFDPALGSIATFGVVVMVAAGASLILAEAAFDFEVALAQISGAIVTSDAGYTATFNGDYDKILVYDGATQVTAATNLSGVTFTVVLLTADVA